MAPMAIIGSMTPQEVATLLFVLGLLCWVCATVYVAVKLISKTKENRR